MKKTLFACLMLALISSSCVNSISEDKEAETPIVKFTVNYSAETRTSVSDVASSLVCYDFMGTTLKQQISQSNTDADFGSFALEVEPGSHEFYFVAHNSSTVEFNRSTNAISFDKISDTFLGKCTIEADGTDEISQSITLNRCVGLFRMVEENPIPENVAYIDFVFSDFYATVNANTGYAYGKPEPFTRRATIPASYIGSSGVGFSTFGFMPEDGYSTTITVEIFSKTDDLVNSVVLEDVPLYRNIVTEYSGDVFSTHAFGDIDFTVDPAWSDTIKVNF